MHPVQPLCAFALGLAALVAAAPARAEPTDPLVAADGDPEDDDDPRDPAFRYRTPAKRYPFRAAMEEAAILAGGYAQYALDKSNASDFDLGYDWPSFRSKLTLDSVAFDDNHFDTNWLTHPGAGYLYYSAARGNRLGVFESFVLATASSTLWEFVGEFREQVAVNDLVVTPASGMALGEGGLQLGAFFHRAKRTPLTIGLGWVFAPFKSAHDAIDGLEPERASELDDVGLPNDTWHRIHLGVGVGVTAQDHGLTQLDTTVSLRSRLVNLHHYGRVGRTATWFDSGEISRMSVEATMAAGSVVDFAAASHVVAAGWASQDVGLDAVGRLEGNGIVAGIAFGAEYARHDWDRDRRRGADRLAMVQAGPMVEHTLYARGIALRTGIDVTGDFAGVDAYALPEYQLTAGRALGDGAYLVSVLRKEAYYHGLGVTVRPSVEVETAAGVSAGADLRFDRFQAITALAREPDVDGTPLAAHDRRVVARAWAAVLPLRHLEVRITAERRQRSGRVGEASAERGETTVHTDVAVRF